MTVFRTRMRGPAALAVMLATLLWAVTPVGATEPAPSGMALLTRLQQAAQSLDYTGVFIYQQGSMMQSARIAHVKEGDNERQRLEVLDGRTRREFLRHNDEVRSLIPEKRTIVIERRRTERFPGMFIGDIDGLAAHYRFDIEEELGRVAGRECHVINVAPLDDLRYGYRLYADVDTGLLLKAQTIAVPPHAPSRTVLEQVAFSEVRVGAAVDPLMLEPRWATGGWKEVWPEQDADLASAGWRIEAPAGFRTITQVRRDLAHGASVGQVVLSDGLAAISVFIEPMEASRPRREGGIERGAINVYGRELAGHWLTVVGEVPASTVRDVALAVRFEPSTH